MIENEDIMKQLTIITRKLNSLESSLQKLSEQYGYVSAELQRLRQIINKGVKQ